MSEFEFIAVFISIIFGLALTQILSGAIYLIQRNRLNTTHLGWTLFILYVLILDWWTFFPWVDNEVWTFDQFFIVLAWAFAHYAVATALYPSRTLEDYQFIDESRRSVCWTFIAAAVLDGASTAMRGDFFDPWYYSVFIAYMIVFASLGLLTSNDKVHKSIPWILVVSMAIWSLIVRRFLG